MTILAAGIFFFFFVADVQLVYGQKWRGACRGKWPDPGPLRNCINGGCNTEYSQPFDFNETSGDVTLTHYLPGNGEDYTCRYKTMSTESWEGGCAGIVPKFPKVTVMALSKYRKLSPCHIQTAWIVSSTYKRKQYGYPKVRLAPENNSTRDWQILHSGTPSYWCPTSGVKEFHSFVCFYDGDCHVDTNANAYNNCYYLNSTFVGGVQKRAGSVCDYTICA